MSAAFPSFESPSRKHLNRAYALLRRAELQRNSPSPDRIGQPLSIVEESYQQGGGEEADSYYFNHPTAPATGGHPSAVLAAIENPLPEQQPKTPFVPAAAAQRPAPPAVEMVGVQVPTPTNSTNGNVGPAAASGGGGSPLQSNSFPTTPAGGTAPGSPSFNSNSNNKQTKGNNSDDDDVSNDFEESVRGTVSPAATITSPPKPATVPPPPAPPPPAPAAAKKQVVQPKAINNNNTAPHPVVRTKTPPSRPRSPVSTTSSTTIPKAQFSEGIAQPKPAEVEAARSDLLGREEAEAHYKREHPGAPENHHPELYQHFTQHIAGELTALKQQHGQALQEISRLREMTEGLRRESRSSSVAIGNPSLPPRGSTNIVSPAMTPVGGRVKNSHPVSISEEEEEMGNQHHHYSRGSTPTGTRPRSPGASSRVSHNQPLPRSPSAGTPRRSTSGGGVAALMSDSVAPKPRRNVPSPTASSHATGSRPSSTQRKPVVPASARGKPMTASEVKKHLAEAKAKKEAEERSRRGPSPNSRKKRVEEFDYTRRLLAQHKHNIEDHSRLKKQQEDGGGSVARVAGLGNGSAPGSRTGSPKAGAGAPGTLSGRSTPNGGRGRPVPIQQVLRSNNGTRSPGGRRGGAATPTSPTGSNKEPLSPKLLAQHRKKLRESDSHPTTKSPSAQQTQAVNENTELSPLSETSPIGGGKNQSSLFKTSQKANAGGGAAAYRNNESQVKLTDDILQVLVELPLAPAWQLESVIERFSNDRPQDWVLMTSIINHPSVIQSLLTPLLIEDLMDPTTDKTRGEYILKAIIGFGVSAASALEPLLDLLYTNRFDRKLVALGIRVVGGDQAIERLSDIVLTNPSATIRSAAVYALLLMPEPVTGRTTVCVAPTTNAEGQAAGPPPMASFFESPSLGGSDDENDELGGRGKQLQHKLENFAVVRLPKPTYSATNVILDLELAKNILRPFVHSPQYRPREKYALSTMVLSDFFTSVPMLLRGMDLSEASTDVYLTTLASLRKELQHVLRNTSGVRSKLPYDFRSYIGTHSKVRSITMTTLLTRLNDETEVEIRKEIIAGMISLPPNVALTAFEPLVHFAENLSRSASVELHCGVLVLLGKLAGGAPMHKDHESVRRVLRNLGKCLDSENSKVREAAAIALGLAGEEASTSADLIVIQHNQRRITDEVACTALANIGRTGIAVLLDLLENKSRKLSTRLWAAKSLGRAPISPENERLIDLMETMATSLCEVLAQQKENPEGELLCVACVEALGSILRPFAPAVTDSLTDEAIHLFEKEKQSPLIDQLLPVVTQCSNQRLREVAAETLSRFGGANGEVALIQASMKNDSPLVRSVAVRSLAFRGISALRPVALATADADEDVRHAALTVLQIFGIDQILAAARARPEDQKAVLLKCCSEFLRFRGSVPFIQELHDDLAKEVVQ